MNGSARVASAAGTLWVCGQLPGIADLARTRCMIASATCTLSRGRAVALGWRRYRLLDIDDPGDLRKPVDNPLGKQEGDVQRGKPDREDYQERVQVCGG